MIQKIAKMLSQSGIGFFDAEQFFVQLKGELEDYASMLRSLHLIENGLQNQGRELSRRLTYRVFK